ncbi:MAG: hypothetical protein RIC35_10210 [Marinoscillum sp.]
MQKQRTISLLIILCFLTLIMETQRRVSVKADKFKEYVIEAYFENQSLDSLNLPQTPLFASLSDNNH